MHKIEHLAATRSFCAPLAAFLAMALLAPAAARAQAAPKLIPAPRELHAAALIPIASATVVVPGPEANSEDLFTARDRTQALAAAAIQMAPATGAPDLFFDLLHAHSPQPDSPPTEPTL